MAKIKAENLLAELLRIRKDMGEDKSDIEWLAIHHAFVFLSYKMSDFQAYVAEANERGEFDQYEP